jgi:hypothetical protein
VSDVRKKGGHANMLRLQTMRKCPPHSQDGLNHSIMSHTHDITAYFRDLLRLRLLAPLLGILDTVHKALAHLAVTWPPSISTDTLSTDTLTRPNSFPPGSSFQPGYPGNQPQILLILEPIHRPSNKVVFPSVSMGKQPTASTVVSFIR